MSIADRALLVHRSLTAWSGRRYDPAESRDLTERRGAATDSARVNKLLVPKDVLRPIEQHDGEWQRWHESMTLPYPARGFAILCGEAYFDYCEGTTVRTEARLRLVDQLGAVLPGALSGAATRLGGLLKPGDVPEVDWVLARYTAEVVFLPFPDTSKIDALIGERAANDTARYLDSTVADAMRDVWQRVYDVAERMRERLEARNADPTARVYASVVDNVRELAALLPKLNLTGDTRLDQMGREIAKRLAVWSVEELREDEGARATAIDESKRLCEAMRNGGYV
jgi:hypothetical protein